MGKLKRGMRNKNEIDFCRNQLKPLLEALGPQISNLRYRGGNNEFGKDFTFSYVNPLNKRVNVGIQAKWGDIKGHSTSLVTTIVNQCDVAFEMPYKNKPDDPDLFLNELYIVCSGVFKDNANEIINRTLKKKLSVFFLDGSDIENLRQKALSRSTGEKEEATRALSALLIEIDQNAELARKIKEHSIEFIENKKHFMNRYRLNCLERVLEIDLDDKEILNLAVISWNLITIQNNYLNEIGVCFAEVSERKAVKMRILADTIELITTLESFKTSVTSYLDNLD